MNIGQEPERYTSFVQTPALANLIFTENYPFFNI